MYWAEAVSTVVYLKNISITKGTHGKNATLYKLWHGRRPDVEHLRVWGCTAYAHIHAARRRDKKWSPRAERLIFLGYSLTTKQYRLYDPHTKRLITSRDVMFHEATPYYGSCQPRTSIRSASKVRVPTGSDTDDDSSTDEDEPRNAGK